MLHTQGCDSSAHELTCLGASAAVCARRAIASSRTFWAGLCTLAAATPHERNTPWGFRCYFILRAQPWDSSLATALADDFVLGDSAAHCQFQA